MSGDYAACAKAAAVLAYVHEVPLDLQEAVRQALIEDTYGDDGGVGADSPEMLSNLQNEIIGLLGKGGFQVKSWECSGQEDVSKYLGMTWNQRITDTCIGKFLLKLRHGIPSGEDLDSKFLQERSVPITKKNVLSVACQF